MVSESRHDGGPLAIAVTDLTKVFQRSKRGAGAGGGPPPPVSVPHGQVVAFLDPNGASKTTTTKMLEDVTQLPT